jgi:hypothetical protein
MNKNSPHGTQRRLAALKRKLYDSIAWRRGKLGPPTFCCHFWGVEGNLHFFFFLHRYLQNGDRKPKSMSNHGWSSQPEIHVAMLVADKTSDSSNDA